MLFFRLVLCGLATCALAGCHTPSLQLSYSLVESDKIVDFAANRSWQPAWSDTLVARLERGAIPAYTQRDQPLPADSLQSARQLHGLIIGADPRKPLLHGARTLKGILPPETGQATIDLHFYDSAIGLYLFYARVRQPDLEQLADRPLEFVSAK